jgi:hypothetical protein
MTQTEHSRFKDKRIPVPLHTTITSAQSRLAVSGRSAVCVQTLARREPATKWRFTNVRPREGQDSVRLSGCSGTYRAYSLPGLDKIQGAERKRSAYPSAGLHSASLVVHHAPAFFGRSTTQMKKQPKRRSFQTFRHTAASRATLKLRKRNPSLDHPCHCGLPQAYLPIH